MHTLLVKANLALFKGERSETQRLLREYQSQREIPVESDPSTPMILWLDAQTQADPAERLRRLEQLVHQTHAQDHYRQLALAILKDERDFQVRMEALQSRFRLPFNSAAGRALGLLIIGALVTFTLVTVFSPPSRTSVAPPLTLIAPTPAPTAIDLPDRSRALVADSFTARYTNGILQVTAVEEQSERVLNSSSLVQVTPVPGARFYALNVIFECRGPICNQPPEANLALQLDNGSLIEPRRDVVIAGQPTLQPIALGRTTSGWVIFEIPLTSATIALTIRLPNVDPTTPSAPLAIRLQ